MPAKIGAVWEDREVLFDLPFSYLKLRPGEKIFDRIEPVEDTKGNSGTKGRLVITCLRIIWHSLASPRINLSVGLNCILSASTKVVNSGLRGTTQALYILAAFKASRYEFIFTNLAPKCVRHYTTVLGVHKAYVASRLYRDLKLRSAIIHNKQLRLLPLEKICLEEHGVWNLSSDTGNLGTLIVTNVRVVWFADVNDGFNASLPYITIEGVTVRDSKFGQALVITTRPSSGGYVLGFRADPPDRLQTLAAEISTLHQAYSERPVFGVVMNWGNQVPQPVADDIEEFQEIGEPRGEMGPNLYIASQLVAGAAEDTRPVYSSYLGLAIEPLQEGFTLKNLFEVQSRRSAIAERARLHAEWAALKSSELCCEVLRGVVALVSVGEGSKAVALRAALAALGATVAPEWSPLVTHVIWTPEGCRLIRAKARSLAARIVSPLWVEACASASRRLPEKAFPTATRPSDLPSPRLLRKMLKTAEKENIPLSNSSDSIEKPLRLRLSSDKDTSNNTSKDTSADTSTDKSRENLPSRVNTLPRRALPTSTSQEPPKKSRRKLFTYKEGENIGSSSEDENKETRPIPPRPKLPPKSTKNTKSTPAPSCSNNTKTAPSVGKATPRERRELARAERMARRLANIKEPGQLPATQYSSTVKPWIVLTGMSRAERHAACEAIRKLNGRLQTKVNKKTTHIVLGSCREDGPQNNFNITGVTALENRPFGFRNNDENQTQKSKDFPSTEGSTYVNVPSTCKSRLCEMDNNKELVNGEKDSANGVKSVPVLPVVESGGKSCRTLNALLGAARGCRVLWVTWVLQSAAAGRWLHPYGFEVRHLRKISEKARIERTGLGLTHSDYAYNVFCGMRAKIRYDASQRDAAILLFNLCGGHFVDSNPDVVIGQECNDVSSKWVFDSVAVARPRTVRRYRVREMEIIERLVQEGRSQDSNIIFACN